MTRDVASFSAIDRREFLELCGGSLAFAAAGCARRNDRAYSRSSTVIVGVSGDEALNPTPRLDQPLWLAFLPLVALNDKGDWEGRLAERWEHSPDYLEWTYYLRRGVRWHDGVPVTAHDIKFTLELFTSVDVLELAPGAIESIAVLDDYTVKVRHRHAETYPWDEVHYPKHLLEHLDTTQFWKWDFWKHPVGNGPYRFVRYQPRTMMEFQANPDYYRGKPKIERVVLKFVGESGLSDLLAEDVDAISRVNPVWIPSLTADVRFVVYYSDMPYYAVICWQQGQPFFRDPRVRRALTLAINRRQLLELLHLPKDAPLTDGPVTRRQLRRGKLAEPLPHDPAQARELLEEAGWHDRDGDGVREREGLAFRFKALVPSEGGAQLAIYVQAQLSRVGVEMAIEMRERNQIRRRLEVGEFQAAFYSDAVLFQRYGLTGPNVVRTKGLGYKNARVVELVNHTVINADPDVEDRIYAELREIFQEEVPATYLVPFMPASVAHRRIRGLRSPFRTDALRIMDELRLQDER